MITAKQAFELGKLPPQSFLDSLEKDIRAAAGAKTPQTFIIYDRVLSENSKEYLESLDYEITYVPSLSSVFPAYKPLNDREGYIISWGHMDTKLDKQKRDVREKLGDAKENKAEIGKVLE